METRRTRTYDTRKRSKPFKVGNKKIYTKDLEHKKKQKKSLKIIRLRLKELLQNIKNFRKKGENFTKTEKGGDIYKTEPRMSKKGDKPVETTIWKDYSKSQVSDIRDKILKTKKKKKKN